MSPKPHFVWPQYTISVQAKENQVLNDHVPTMTSISSTMTSWYFQQKLRFVGIFEGLRGCSENNLDLFVLPTFSSLAARSSLLLDNAIMLLTSAS